MKTKIKTILCITGKHGKKFVSISTWRGDICLICNYKTGGIK